MFEKYSKQQQQKGKFHTYLKFKLLICNKNTENIIFNNIHFLCLEFENLVKLNSHIIEFNILYASEFSYHHESYIIIGSYARLGQFWKYLIVIEERTKKKNLFAINTVNLETRKNFYEECYIEYSS